MHCSYLKNCEKESILEIKELLCVKKISKNFSMHIFVDFIFFEKVQIYERERADVSSL